MEPLIERLASTGVAGIMAAIALILLNRAHQEKTVLAEQVRRDQNEIMREIRTVLMEHTKASTILAEKIAELPDRLLPFWHTSAPGRRDEREGTR